MNSFLSLLSDLHHHWQSATASLIAGGALLADVINDAKGWEDVSLKVLLLLAVVFLVGVVIKQQQKYDKANADREQKVLDALNRTADSVDELKNITQQQTSFFETVVKDVVAERLKGPVRPPHSPQG